MDAVESKDVDKLFRVSTTTQLLFFLTLEPFMIYCSDFYKNVNVGSIDDIAMLCMVPGRGRFVGRHQGGGSQRGRSCL